MYFGTLSVQIINNSFNKLKHSAMGENIDFFFNYVKVLLQIKAGEKKSLNIAFERKYAIFPFLP